MLSIFLQELWVASSDSFRVNVADARVMLRPQTEVTLICKSDLMIRLKIKREQSVNTHTHTRVCGFIKSNKHVSWLVLEVLKATNLHSTAQECIHAVAKPGLGPREAVGDSYFKCSGVSQAR